MGRHCEVVGDVALTVFWVEEDRLWFWSAERWVDGERRYESAANADFDYSLAEARREARKMALRTDWSDPVVVVRDAEVVDFTTRVGGPGGRR